MSERINFKVNEKIEILMEDGIYKSNIQDLTDEYIAISVPVKSGSYLPLRKGEIIEGIYYQDKSVYKFFTPVLGRKIDRIMMITLKKPEKFTKIQRRNFVRVYFLSNILFAVIGNKNGLLDINGDEITFDSGYALDLSAGGIRLSATRDLYLGDIIMMNIPVKEENLSLKGKVVRVEKDENNKGIYGICFIDIDNKTVDKIMRILFQIMREQRKLGIEGD
ncbi:flagellar brake domain-containing protein [Clostridium sp. HMP27]|uniref:flagellar brake protein n=1 Tax=Clostridium sp. HMP27 TaxID=1487921 RepID=UPI00052DB693|nr:flagellar brake domain-containing protein [Clostridium sp. HMP27]KGK86116.1 flagellar protein [Clostridium sp. HMP27]